MIKPLLAAKKPKDWSWDKFLDHIDRYYPLIATPKIDGFRCQTSGSVPSPRGWVSVPLTRSLKNIPNHYLRGMLGALPSGLDGEIISGNFQETQSRVMSAGGEFTFQYHVFDCRIDEHAAQSLYPKWPYEQRLFDLRHVKLPPFCIKELGLIVQSREDLLAYEAVCLEQGYEGVMLRKPNSRYKLGRSTLNEFILVALKRTEDAEGVIVGFTEKMHNSNEAERDLVGNMRRPSHKEGMVSLNTLGALIVEADIGKGRVQFQIGTGLTETDRVMIWSDRDRYLGRQIKFKYQQCGTKERPRTPVFLGFREEGT